MQTPRITRNWLADLSTELIRGLVRLCRIRGGEFHIAGGAVREWLAGRVSHDLDLTVRDNAFAWAETLADLLGAAFVPLDREEGVARVVWQGMDIDFCQYRGGATTLEADLGLRDFTVNAMAMVFDPSVPGLRPPYSVIDPTGGGDDFAARRLKATSDKIFRDDPLRLLRAYRFVGELDFDLEPHTASLVQRDAGLITEVAGERIAYELWRILAVKRAHGVVAAMAANGLLTEVFPELGTGVGVEQPASHHLDVFAHNLEALCQMEEIQAAPERFFPDQGQGLAAYLDHARNSAILKWAALFHDLGKPATRDEKAGRFTFYQHERAGARQFATIARRLGLSRADREQIGRLIELHMWPFHLNNVMRREGDVTARACLRLAKAVGDDLPGLFLLAMADSLAGQGEEKPLDMEESLARLYARVVMIYNEHIRPVLTHPRLLDGHDLQELFGLVPGPRFSTIFNGLEEAAVSGEVVSREQALQWVRAYLAQEGKEF